MLTLTSISLYWCPKSSIPDLVWDVGDLAAVHPSAPGAIFLTPQFFNLPTTGKDSQQGTIVHELSHRSGATLKPEVYQPRSCEKSSILQSGECAHKRRQFRILLRGFAVRRSLTMTPHRARPARQRKLLNVFEEHQSREKAKARSPRDVRARRMTCCLQKPPKTDCAPAKYSRKCQTRRQAAPARNRLRPATYLPAAPSPSLPIPRPNRLAKASPLCRRTSLKSASPTPRRASSA